MALQESPVNLSLEELRTLYDERADLIDSLRDRVRALELERDQALNGLHMLTEALRRRGCCDGHESGGAL